MSTLEKWINAVLNEDAEHLSIGSVRTLQMIKHEFERLQKENAEMEERIERPKKHQSEWIRLDGNPAATSESGKDVLILFETGEVRRLFEEDLPRELITHFMPMPEPPKTN